MIDSGKDSAASKALDSMYMTNFRKFVLPSPSPSSGTDEDGRRLLLACTAADNFSRVGFLLPDESVRNLSRCSEQDIVSFYGEMMPLVKNMSGADKEYKLFYPNFPKEVMDKSRAEIFLNVLVYELTGFEAYPGAAEEEKDKFPYIGKNADHLLTEASEEDYRKDMENLMHSETVWSPKQKEAVRTMIQNDAQWKQACAGKLPCKENAVNFALMAESLGKGSAYDYIKKEADNVTDILRLVTRKCVERSYTKDKVDGLRKMYAKYGIEIKAEAEDAFVNEAREKSFDLRRKADNSMETMRQETEILRNGIFDACSASKRVNMKMQDIDSILRKYGYPESSHDSVRNGDADAVNSFKKSAGRCIHLLLMKTSDCYKMTSNLYSCGNKIHEAFMPVSEAMLAKASSLMIKHPDYRMPREERKKVLSLIEKVARKNPDNATEDIYRHKVQWKDLIRCLHAQEFERYPHAEKAFLSVSTNRHKPFAKTYIERAIAEGDVEYAVRCLASRPGEFGRRLDKLIRICRNESELALLEEGFRKAAPKMSSQLLLSIDGNLYQRSKEESMRIIRMKSGSIASDKILQPLPEEVCDNFRLACLESLCEKYKGKTPMGKVYISESLAGYRVNDSASLRDSNSSLSTYGEGSRIPVEIKDDSEVLFIHWTNGVKSDKEQRIDNDLHAELLDENFDTIGRVGWDGDYYDFNGKSGAYAYSGDIQDGKSADGKGVAEMIRINLDECIEKGARYVTTWVHSYPTMDDRDRSAKFSEQLHVDMGWMPRCREKFGQNFEAKAVQEMKSLTANSESVVPCIFDLKTREVIWADIPMSIGNGAVRYDENARDNIKTVSYRAAHAKTAPLIDVIEANVAARGERVYTQEEADLVFAPENEIEDTSKAHVLPSDITYISGELMTGAKAGEPGENPVEELAEETDIPSNVPLENERILGEGSIFDDISELDFETDEEEDMDGPDDINNSAFVR